MKSAFIAEELFTLDMVLITYYRKREQLFFIQVSNPQNNLKFCVKFQTLFSSELRGHIDDGKAH